MTQKNYLQYRQQLPVQVPEDLKKVQVQHYIIVQLEFLHECKTKIQKYLGFHKRLEIGQQTVHHHLTATNVNLNINTRHKYTTLMTTILH